MAQDNTNPKIHLEFMKKKNNNVTDKS